MHEFEMLIFILNSSAFYTTFIPEVIGQHMSLCVWAPDSEFNE